MALKGNVDKLPGIFPFWLLHLLSGIFDIVV
jgi:hypothetical protein